VAERDARPGPVERRRSGLGLELPLGGAGQHQAVHLHPGPLPQREQGAAAADLHVVGVGPDRDDLQRPGGQVQVPHVVATNRGAGTGTSTGSGAGRTACSTGRRHSAHGLSPDQ
jgi:hypothetical protein